MRFIIALLAFSAATRAADVTSKARIYLPAATTRPAAADPIKLESGPHLFTDDFLIASRARGADAPT